MNCSVLSVCLCHNSVCILTFYFQGCETVLCSSGKEDGGHVPLQGPSGEEPRLLGPIQERRHPFLCWYVSSKAIIKIMLVILVINYYNTYMHVVLYSNNEC